MSLSDLTVQKDQPTRIPRSAALPAATAVLAVLRPWYWPVSLGPATLGYVLAAGSWTPPGGWGLRHLATILVLGPLVWGAVLAMNDRHDIRTDRANPRKATTPLVTGQITVADLHRLQHWFVAAALVVASVDVILLAGTIGVLLLGWAYSSPPLRLKGRPGADVAANAVVVGFLAPLCGWSLHAGVLDYPPILAVTGTLIAVAFYIPTTVIDRIADRSAGDVTFAVRYGDRVPYWSGVVAWGGSTALWLVMCVRGLVPAGQLPWHGLACAVMMLLYAGLMRRPSIGRLAVVFAFFAIPAALFLAGIVAGHPYTDAFA